jgi:hypothetical protein
LQFSFAVSFLQFFCSFPHWKRSTHLYPSLSIIPHSLVLLLTQAVDVVNLMAEPGTHSYQVRL